MHARKDKLKEIVATKEFKLLHSRAMNTHREVDEFINAKVESVDDNFTRELVRARLSILFMSPRQQDNLRVASASAPAEFFSS